MEEVDCAECGNRYDSDEHPFCPRCGNAGTAGRVGQGSADFRPQRFDPSRRRTRAGGVILAIVGGLAFLQFAYVTIAPPALDPEQLEALQSFDLLAEQAGGDLHVQVLLDGAPVQANVTVRPASGDAQHVVATRGWANFTGVPAAFGNLSVVAGNATLDVSYYAPAGGTVVADVDLAQPPDWIGAQSLPAVRGIAGFLAFFAAFVVLGGVAAIRLRWWRVALAGAIVAVAPGAFFLLVDPLAGLLLALPAAVALAFIAMGKKHFA